jgi:hypothetical protein
MDCDNTEISTSDVADTACELQLLSLPIEIIRCIGDLNILAHYGLTGSKTYTDTLLHTDKLQRMFNSNYNWAIIGNRKWSFDSTLQIPRDHISEVPASPRSWYVFKQEVGSILTTTDVLEDDVRYYPLVDVENTFILITNHIITYNYTLGHQLTYTTGDPTAPRTYYPHGTWHRHSGPFIIYADGKSVWLMKAVTNDRRRLVFYSKPSNI